MHHLLRSLPGLLFSLLCLLPAAPAHAGEVRGTVTLAGSPAGHVLVQALETPDSPQPLAEGYTDRQGRYVLEVRNGPTVLRAQRSYQDREGYSHRLRSLPSSPVDPGLLKKPVIDLALTLVEKQGRWHPAAPAAFRPLLDWQKPLSAQELARIDALYRQALTQDDPAARRRLFQSEASLLRTNEADEITDLLEVDLKAAERTDPARFLKLVAVLEDLAVALELDWMRADALGLRAYGSFMAGRPPEGIEAARQAVALLDQVIAAEKRPGFLQTRKRAQAQTLVAFSVLQAITGEPKAAREARERALELEEETLLVREHGASHRAIGSLALALGDRAAAERHFRESVGIFTELDAPEDRAIALVSLARLQPLEQSVANFRAAATGFRRAGNRLEAARSEMLAGAAMVSAKRHADAVPVLQGAVKELEALPVSPERLTAAALALTNLGQAQYELKRYQEALETYARALELDEKLKQTANIALDQQMIGYCHDELEQPQKAVTWLVRASNTRLQLGGDEIPLGLILLRQAGYAALEQDHPGRLDEALKFYEKALELAKKHSLPEEQAEAHRAIGEACLTYGRDSEAELRKGIDHLESARQQFTGLGREEDAQRASRFLSGGRRSLAHALADKGQTGEAIRLLTGALEAAEKAGSRPEAAENRDALAWLHFEAGAWAEAVKHWEPVVAWLRTPDAVKASEETRALLSDPSSGDLLHPARRLPPMYHLMSIAWWNLGDAPKAIKALGDELEMLEKAGRTTETFQPRWLRALYSALSGDLTGHGKELAKLEASAATDSQRAQLITLRLLAHLGRPTLTGALEESRRWLAVRLDAARKLPVEPRAAFAGAWNTVGTLYARSGHPREALQVLERARELAPDELRPAVLSEIGRTHRLAGHLQEALEAQQQVYRARQALASSLRPSDLAAALIEVSELQLALGDVKAARLSLQEAAGYAEAIQKQPVLLPADHKVLGDLWGMNGMALFLGGDNKGALEALDQAARHYERSGVDERALKHRVFQLRARFSAEVSAYSRAVSEHATGLETLEKELEPVKAQLQKLEADGKEKKARALRDELNGKLAAYKTRGQQIDAGMAQKQAALQAELLALIDQCVAAGAFDALVFALIGDFTTGKPTAAWWELKLKKLEAARDKALATGSLYHLPFLEVTMAVAYENRGDLGKAAELYRASIDSLELLRGSILNDQQKIGFLDVNDEYIYSGYLKLLLRQGQVEEALEVSERSRARAFLDVLATAELTRAVQKDPRAVELEGLLDQLEVVAREDETLSPAALLPAGLTRVEGVDGTTGERQPLQAAPRLRSIPVVEKRERLAKLKQEIDSRRQALAGSGAEVVSLVSAAPPTVAQMKAIAKRTGATVLEYYITSDTLIIFTLTPDGEVKAEQVAVEKAALEATIAAARRSMGVESGRGLKIETEEGSSPAGAGGNEAAVDPLDPSSPLSALHRWLVAPVSGQLPADPAAPVYVVPHRSLFLVPFAALPDASKRYLVQRHPLVFTPALGVLRYTEKKRTPAPAGPKSVLVVGNPAMPRGGETALPPLPGAEAEANAIAGILKGAKVTTLTGAKASEPAVLAAMPQARIIHLATHGVARDDDALRSFVAMAPARGATGAANGAGAPAGGVGTTPEAGRGSKGSRPRAGGAGDGLLTVEEIFGLSIQAELVTLSACQTGLGRISGDGVMGLGRAFLYAGTPSVLVSLWSVSDEATAFQMEGFYRALAGGASRVEALRAAQLATLEKYPAPALWAAFTLIGEGK